MPALPVAIPLIVAALLAGATQIVSRRILDIAAILTSLAVLVICCLLTWQTIPQPIIYWLGDWHPVGHFPLGICLVIDPLAAAMVAMVSLMVLAGFVFSWHYFDSAQSYYHSIVLVFMGAMIGLSLTGDFFNLFVFFELMTACGVSLCGYKSKAEGPLQGALNFAVINTLGAFITLMGISLVYSYTGTLNMAEAGHTLATHPPGGLLVPISFGLILCGFLAKAAAFPFHFWLADAHAVAPTPISVLFSGVMVELGLYAVFRLYAATFSHSSGPSAEAVRVLFLIIGTSTSLVGGILCFLQRHLKRLLAYSTISHMGVMFLGLAIWTPKAVAGTALYLVGHGLIKGGLFFCAGILLHHFGTVDEFELRGRGRGVYVTMILMLIAGIGLTGVPPFATCYGGSLIHDAAEHQGLWWVAIFFVVSGFLTAGAVFRVTARTFWDMGDRQSPATAGAPKITEQQETHGPRGRTPATMWLPTAIVIFVGMLLAIPIGLRSRTVAFAQRDLSTSLYRDAVLEMGPVPALQSVEVERTPKYIVPLVALALAIIAAFFALYPGYLRLSKGSGLGQTLDRGVQALRALHSGRVGDYVAWLVLGIAIYGFILLI